MKSSVAGSRFLLPQTVGTLSGSPSRIATIGLHAFHGRFARSSVRGGPGSNEPANASPLRAKACNDRPAGTYVAAQFCSAFHASDKK